MVKSDICLLLLKSVDILANIMQYFPLRVNMKGRNDT